LFPKIYPLEALVKFEDFAFLPDWRNMRMITQPTNFPEGVAAFRGTGRVTKANYASVLGTRSAKRFETQQKGACVS